MAQEILQTMGLRSFMPMVIACPGCGRTTSTVFQELAQDIQSHIRTRMPVWQKAYPGFETLQLAVMGCIVNGPGESKHADIGISLPGTGEVPAAPVYIDGKKVKTLRGSDIGLVTESSPQFVQRTLGRDRDRPFQTTGFFIDLIRQHSLSFVSTLPQLAQGLLQERQSAGSFRDANDELLDQPRVDLEANTLGG